MPSDARTNRPAQVSYELLKAGLAVNEMSGELFSAVGVEPTPVADAVADLLPSASRPRQKREYEISRGSSPSGAATGISSRISRGSEEKGGPEKHAEEHTHTLDESTVEDRTVALVADVSIDRRLFKPRKTDSRKTRAARAALQALATDLREVLAAYDRAQATANRARDAAVKAAAELERARAREEAARLQYEKDRALLVELVNDNYEQASLSPLMIVMTAEDPQELVSGMAHLEQLGVSRVDVVDAAEKSAEKMAKAAKATAAANSKAQASARAAAVALAQATRARDAVVADVVTAQQLLGDAVLADEAAASLAAAKKHAQRLKRGSVAFPLPKNSRFVDQGNWGNTGSNWGSVHTGNDFSVACGTAVYAATSGTVSIRTDQGWAGPQLVTVSTGKGSLTTWYAHMQSVTVADGDTVTAGQVIGAVGSEGNSTGCHLHFEYHPLGGSIYEDSEDPVAWLKSVGAYPR